VGLAAALLTSMAVFAALAGPAVARASRRERVLAMLPGSASEVGTPGVIERIGRSPLGRYARPSEEINRRLLAAGQPLSPDALTGARVVAGAIALGGGLALAVARPSAVLLVPVFALIGARGPDLWLARRVRRRTRTIARQVVDLVEILVATTDGGLGPGEALRRAAHVLRPPLGDELSVAVQEIDLGASWRTALDDLVARVDDAALRRLTRALERSQRLGTTVRNTLRGVAADLRDDRRVRAEEAARRAPVKMLFPLVLLILPAFLLLTVGPVLLGTLRSLHSG
jgi:tight adherence protein C